MGEGKASVAEWRTTPLWNVGRTAEVGGEEVSIYTAGVLLIRGTNSLAWW